MPRRPEYEPPRVRALRQEIAEIEEATRARVRALEEQIEAEREQHGYLHELLTASGDGLVQAVIRTLKTLGFRDVRDVDAAAEAKGDTGPRREDIQLMDAAVPVLVEVKGVRGTSKESGSLQVHKYLAPRMREWNNPNIRGLSIINHQRYLPALDREHEHAFQRDVLINAEEQGFGLLTTWDLFRLARGFLAHGWKHEDVAGLFVTDGRIHPIPSHYELIGVIDGYWEKASVLGLRVQTGEVRVGDRVAFELPVEFAEEEIVSLRLDEESVDRAATGMHVGVRTNLTKQQARKGVRVYRVAQQPGKGDGAARAMARRRPRPSRTAGPARDADRPRRAPRRQPRGAARPGSPDCAPGADGQNARGSLRGDGPSLFDGSFTGTAAAWQRSSRCSSARRRSPRTTAGWRWATRITRAA